jgi:hypothetical protein
VPLVLIDDINVHLPKDKLGVLNANDDALQLDVERIIKAKLSGTFSPATIASWTLPGAEFPPATVPHIIQEVAGKLIAAFVYARTFSSEVAGLPEYAQWLYDQAMMTLEEIILGATVIPPEELPGGEVVDTGGRLTSDMFWPNDTTGGDRFTRQDQF